MALSPGIHLVHDGPPQAPPLLLIHGSGASGASWTPVVPTLAAHHHVIRVDLPGCGQSPPASSYDVAEQAGRVAATLDGLGLRGLVVAGHSSGGYCATALAEQRPDLVSSLALISTGPSLDALSPEPLALRILMGPPVGALIWRMRSTRMLRRAIEATGARPVDVPAAMVADFKRISYRTFRSVLRANTAYIAERSVPARLGPLGLRVLVLFGDEDPRWAPSSAHQYEAVSTARVEMLPGVGHMPMLEAPDATCRLLLEFTAARARTFS